MNKARVRLIAGVVGVAVLVALGGWLWLHRTTPSQTSKEPSPPEVAHSTAVALGSQAGQPVGALENAVKGLRGAKDAAGARPQLAELRQALAGMSREAASAAIRQLLDSRADAPTHMAFKVGGNGRLDQAPSLRTFLLDYLGQVDPAAAAAYARTILSSPDSADEWAVALRSLAVGDTSASGRALLEQKVGELLRYEPWQQEPSVGYLEAFDAAVFLGGTNLAPALTDLVRRQDNPAVAHAAFLALDRLVIKDTAQLLGALETAPELMQGREATRADYFARADVRDSQQRQALESYLLDSRRSAAELAQFAGVFPNANYMISQNLFTATPTPDHAALVGRDAASLQTVQEWLADPRFAQLQRPLLKVKQRLEDFARQAGR